MSTTFSHIIFLKNWTIVSIVYSIFPYIAKFRSKSKKTKIVLHPELAPYIDFVFLNRYVLGTQTAGNFYNSFSLTTNQWHHYAFVLQPWVAVTGGQGTIMYKNGVQETVADGLRAISFSTAAPGNLVLGRRFVDLDGFYSSLTIDEITIFDVALPVADVMKIYQKSAAPPP